MKKEDFKILLYSALVCGNILIWYEVLGFKFLIGIFLTAMYFLLASNSRKGK